MLCFGFEGVRWCLKRSDMIQGFHRRFCCVELSKLKQQWLHSDFCED